MKKMLPVRIKPLSISFLLDKRALLVTLLLSILSFALILISCGIGDIKIHPLEVIKVFLGQGSEINKLVVGTFRLPRIIVAFLVGAALAVSGAILQGLIRNPLASPDLVGITGGASLAAVTFITMFIDPKNNSLTISISWLPVAAFIGATVIALLVYFLSWKNGVSPIRLVLIGVGINAGMHALTTIMIIFGPLYLATQATLWLTGSVYGSKWEDIYILLPWVGILVPLSFILARTLNVHEMGDDIATGVGSYVQRERFILLLMSTALAGGAVAFVGAIGFVGLMGPHIARSLVGSAFGGLLPVSALIGGILVVLADLIGRTAFLPLDIPAGIFTAAIGAPYFIYLLYKSRNVS